MAELTERQSSVLELVRRLCGSGRPASASTIRKAAWWADAPSVDAALRSLTAKGLLSKPRRGYYLPTEENR
jgi:Mn-dependent DtxR family transcriptional regulator